MTLHLLLFYTFSNYKQKLIFLYFSKFQRGGLIFIFHLTLENSMLPLLRLLLYDSLLELKVESRGNIKFHNLYLFIYFRFILV